MSKPTYRVKQSNVNDPKRSVIEKVMSKTTEFTLKDVLDHFAQMRKARRETESRRSLNQAYADRLKKENKTLFRNKTDRQLMIMAAAGEHISQVKECEEMIAEMDKVMAEYEKELPALKELVGYEEPEEQPKEEATEEDTEETEEE